MHRSEGQFTGDPWFLPSFPLNYSKLFHHPILAFNDLLAQQVWRWLHRWILPTTAMAAMDQSLGTGTCISKSLASGRLFPQYGISVYVHTLHHTYIHTYIKYKYKYKYIYIGFDAWRSAYASGRNYIYITYTFVHNNVRMFWTLWPFPYWLKPSAPQPGRMRSYQWQWWPAADPRSFRQSQPPGSRWQSRPSTCINLHQHGSLNVPIFHITQPLDSIRYMVYNGYYKVMSNIPKMGHLTTPDLDDSNFPPNPSLASLTLLTLSTVIAMYSAGAKRSLG